MSTIGSVRSIYRYPVKSMSGESLDEAAIGPGGLVGDRQWTLRDTETGKLVSAKRIRLWGAMLECRAWYDELGQVHVELPSGRQFELEDPAASRALSGLFERDVAVERFSGPAQGSYESDWPEIEGMVLSGEEGVEFGTNVATSEYGQETDGFVDVAPIHLTTTTGMATLRDANPDLVVDDRRFRPTIVIETDDSKGFPENDWSGKKIRCGGATFSVSGPTLRCAMATAAQGELPTQTDVLKTLLRINGERRELHTGAKGRGAHFGAWAEVSEPGPIRAGDAVLLEG